VAFDDLLAEAMNSVSKKNRTQADLSQLLAAVIKALTEAMPYEPAAVTKSGSMIYSMSAPKESVDKYIKYFGNERQHKAIILHECEL
jgi:hypothetical protein